MKTNFLIISLLFSAITSYSQSKGIVGSWLWRDSNNSIQFFIKSNGTLEKRTALAGEDIWSKTPQTGNYTFKNGHHLVIKWIDNSIENIEVKFIDKNAEFKFIDQKIRQKKSYIFLRIVDEEIIPDN